MQLPDFLDPVLRGPLITCSFMGALCAVVGVLVVFRQRSLMSEVVSHACYPGMVVGALIGAVYFQQASFVLLMSCVITCAVVTSFLATIATHALIHHRLAAADAALSCVLTSFFAVGVFIVSATQIAFPSLWRDLQVLLVGQAATIDDQFMVIGLCVCSIGLVIFLSLYRSIASELFDPDFSSLHLLSSSSFVTSLLLVITVVIGIRFMGVLLMSALFIFPVVSARLLVSKFSHLLMVAATIGWSVGFFGVLISHNYAVITQEGFGKPLWLPTGPLIVLLLGAIFVSVVLFSKEEGVCVRLWRRFLFQRRCRLENVMKQLWRECDSQHTTIITSSRVRALLSASHMVRTKKLLEKKGWLHSLQGGDLEITPAGMQVGRKLVRLHRLWELYLVEYCGMARERVHPSAEEMEHILTPSVERELVNLLQDPLFDPHHKPIPSADAMGETNVFGETHVV